MLKNKVLFSIFMIIFIDLLGFSLILPLLPYIARTYHANDFQTGLLVAIYAAAQLISAPVLGRLSDRYGRRPLLLVSIAGTLLGYIILALANSLWMVFLARLIDGLTAGNISIAQAYISDVTDEKNRARGLGMIGAAFGLGFIIGPAAGGALSAFGFTVPAIVSSVLAIINLALVAAWLPESLSAQRRQALAAQKRATISPRDLLEALRRPQFGPLLHTRFFFGLAFSIFQTIFSLYALERFNLNAQSTGYVLAYVGVLSVITQGFLIGRLTARFSENTLILSAAAVMAFSLLGWALAPNLVTLLLIMAPTSFAGGILNTVINSAITRAVTPEEIGGALGLSAAIESSTRVIAPSLGGLLLDQVGQRYGVLPGTAAPGIFAALIMGWLVFYLWRHLRRSEDTPTQKLAVHPHSGD